MFQMGEIMTQPRTSRGSLWGEKTHALDAGAVAWLRRERCCGAAYRLQIVGQTCRVPLVIAGRTEEAMAMVLRGAPAIVRVAAVVTVGMFRRHGRWQGRRGLALESETGETHSGLESAQIHGRVVAIVFGGERVSRCAGRCVDMGTGACTCTCGARRGLCFCYGSILGAPGLSQGRACLAQELASPIAEGSSVLRRPCRWWLVLLVGRAVQVSQGY